MNTESKWLGFTSLVILSFLAYAAYIAYLSTLEPKVAPENPCEISGCIQYEVQYSNGNLVPFLAVYPDNQRVIEAEMPKFTIIRLFRAPTELEVYYAENTLQVKYVAICDDEVVVYSDGNYLTRLSHKDFVESRDNSWSLYPSWYTDNREHEPIRQLSCGFDGSSSAPLQLFKLPQENTFHIYEYGTSGGGLLIELPDGATITRFQIVNEIYND